MDINILQDLCALAPLRETILNSIKSELGLTQRREGAKVFFFGWSYDLSRFYIRDLQ